MAQEVVIVTGSSGFIGTRLLSKLEGKFQVVALDRDRPSKLLHQEEFLAADFADDTSVKEAFEQIAERWGRQIASVVHLAAYYDFSGQPSEKYSTVTVHGTRRLIECLQRFQVEQLIFSSTMLVYAPCLPGQKINESWPLEPKWMYPQSKLDAEAMIRETRGNIPCLIMRISGVYDNHCHSIPLSHQMRRIYEKQLLSHVFPGKLSHGQSFLHVDDLADAIALAINSRHRIPPWQELLIGEPKTYSYGELQKQFGLLIHAREWDTVEIAKALAKAGAWIHGAVPAGEEPFIKPWMIDIADDHYELDIGRAKRSLGWHPRRTLIDTVPLMVQALKKDPAAWYREHKLQLPASLQQQAA